MSEKTARKQRDLGKLPSELKAEHIRTWRMREDQFEGIWGKIKSFLETNAGLEAETLFEDFQREEAGRFSDGQIWSFQRKWGCGTAASPLQEGSGSSAHAAWES